MQLELLHHRIRVFIPSSSRYSGHDIQTAMGSVLVELVAALASVVKITMPNLEQQRVGDVQHNLYFKPLIREVKSVAPTRRNGIRPREYHFQFSSHWVLVLLARQH